MDKDAYARMQMRQTIVGKYLDKLAKVESKDINLIPALIDYIETGNKEMFDLFLQFCDEYDLQQKEERLRIFQKNLDYYEESYKSQYDRMKQMRKLISDLDDVYRDYSPVGTYNALFRYLEKNNLNTGKQMFVLVDGKIHKITSLREVEKKIVLSTEDHGEYPFKEYYIPAAPDGAPGSDDISLF